MINLKNLTLLIASFLCTYESHALQKPSYLDVPQFTSCFGITKKGSWTAYCLPASKPAACPLSSWKQLEHEPLDKCR